MDTTREAADKAKPAGCPRRSGAEILRSAPHRPLLAQRSAKGARSGLRGPQDDAASRVSPSKANPAGCPRHNRAILANGRQKGRCPPRSAAGKMAAKSRCPSARAAADRRRGSSALASKTTGVILSGVAASLFLSSRSCRDVGRHAVEESPRGMDTTREAADKSKPVGCPRRSGAEILRPAPQRPILAQRSAIGARIGLRGPQDDAASRERQQNRAGAPRAAANQQWAAGVLRTLVNKPPASF